MPISPAGIARLIIVCGALAIAIPFLIPMLTGNAGLAVSERFLERPKDKLLEIKLPPDPGASVTIDAKALRSWVTSHADQARIFASRVMPLDILYLLALGGFLALGAHTLASQTSWATPRLWAIPAIVYLVADATEDALIILFMTVPDSIGEHTLGALIFFRTVKIVSNGIAICIVFLLGIAASI